MKFKETMNAVFDGDTIQNKVENVIQTFSDYSDAIYYELDFITHEILSRAWEIVAE